MVDDTNNAAAAQTPPLQSADGAVGHSVRPWRKPFFAFWCALSLRLFLALLLCLFAYMGKEDVLGMYQSGDWGAMLDLALPFVMVSLMGWVLVCRVLFGELNDRHAKASAAEFSAYKIATSKKWSRMWIVPLAFFLVCWTISDSYYGFDKTSVAYVVTVVFVVFFVVAKATRLYKKRVKVPTAKQ